MHREVLTPSLNSIRDSVRDYDSTFAWPPRDSRHVCAPGPILLPSPSLYFLWFQCFISYSYLTDSYCMQLLGAVLILSWNKGNA